jgi:hypothetical protein
MEVAENPAEILGDLTVLRRKVRRDRHGYTFPLLLFGALILLSSLCYVPADKPTFIPAEGIVYKVEPGPFPVFGIPFTPDMRYPTLIEWYWMLTLLVGFATTAWWYRRRAERTGVETDIRGYLVAGGAALVGFVFGEQVLRDIVHIHGGLYSTPGVNLPILFVSAAASAVIFAAGVRWKRVRGLSLFVGTLLAMVAFSALSVYMINGLTALLIIAAPLLVLAWFERSLLLGTTGLLFTVTAAHANLQGLAHYFPNTFYTDGRWLALQNVALPAAVLIIGGVVALVQARRTTL